MIHTLECAPSYRPVKGALDIARLQLNYNLIEENMAPS